MGALARCVRVACSAHPAWLACLVQVTRRAVGLRLPALLLACATVLAGCAAKNTQPEPGSAGAPASVPLAPLGAYALDGPPLFIAAEYKGHTLEGTMDRHVMVGLGKMELHGTDKAQGFFCEARVNSQPTEKGRIRGVLDCTEGVVLLFTLRATGPDQGVALGRAEAKGDPLVLFFHSSKEEAVRRFPEVKRTMAEAIRRQGK